MTKKVGIQDRRLLVGCDLFLDLQMFRVPPVEVTKLAAKFPQVDLLPMNSPGRPLLREEIEIYWGNRINHNIIESAKQLKWIHFGSVGTNYADLPEVRERGILVTNSRDMVTEAMVASCLAHLASLARGFHHISALRQEGRLTREGYDQHFSEIQDLWGQEVLILGFGTVGRKLSGVLRAIGMRVTGVCRTLEGCSASEDKLITLSDAKDVANRMDYVINLLPLNSQTRNFFDRQFFNSMKTSAFFVNLGRGETVVETDLIEALTNNEICGAGLDVFETEPLPSGSPLWKLSNVIITPHIAGVSQSYWTKQIDLFFFNLSEYLAGSISSMKNIVHTN